MKARRGLFSYLSTKTLIRRNLAEPDDEKAWKYVMMLHFRGTQEVFDAAIQLTKSKKVLERELGVDILSQLGVPERAFPTKTIHYLLSFLKKEKSPIVLRAVGVAFSHLPDSYDHRVVKEIVVLANHKSSQVRFGVVQALTGHEYPLAIKTLIKLSKDFSKEVRDWATFGLGSQIDSNTPAIRKALRSRLNEKDDEIRGEALLGLAKRRAKRISSVIIKELQKRRPIFLVLEAAEEVRDPKVLPALRDLSSRALKRGKKLSLGERNLHWMDKLNEVIASYDSDSSKNR